jgi:hypothetical protein
MARDQRSWKDRKADENVERRAKREQQWEDSVKWRTRKDALKSLGKSEQFEAVRGWVMKFRLDNTKITEAAVKFHYVQGDGAVAHLTVEPGVQELLAAGGAGIVSFLGYNGREHAAVPVDVALDVVDVLPAWLRHLAGTTDNDAWQTADVGRREQEAAEMAAAAEARRLARAEKDAAAAGAAASPTVETSE